MKRMCSMCKQTKEESEFYYCETKNAYNCYCRSCQKMYNREYARIRRAKAKDKKE